MKLKALSMATVLGFAVAVPQFAFAKDNSSTSDKSSSTSSSSTDKSSSGGTGASTSTDTGTSSGAKPGIIVADEAEWQATIQSIDKDTRSVTLKTAEGETKTVQLDKKVKNFDQLKPGDQVKVKALNAVAISLGKPGEAPSSTAKETTMVAPPGNMPAAVMAKTVQKTATVEAIDHSNRTITLKGPEGNSVTMKVDPDVKQFDEIKQGDQIAVTQTQAIAVEVTKPDSQGGTGTPSQSTPDSK